MKDTTVTVRLTDAEKSALKAAAAEIGTTPSQLVRKLIQVYLKEEQE